MQPVRTVVVIWSTWALFNTLSWSAFVCVFCLRNLWTAMEKAWEHPGLLLLAWQPLFNSRRDHRRGWANIYPSLLVPHTVRWIAKWRCVFPLFQLTQSLASLDQLLVDSVRSFFTSRICPVSSVTSSKASGVLFVVVFLSRIHKTEQMCGWNKTALPVHEICSWEGKCGRQKQKKYVAFQVPE